RRNCELKDSDTWRLSRARELVQRDTDWRNKFTQCLYRPFDIRLLYYHDALVERPRREVMQHLLNPNIALITTRQVTSLMFCHTLVSRCPVEFKCVSHDRNCNTFPLYLYPSEPTAQSTFVTDTRYRPNLSPACLKAFGENLNLVQIMPHGLPSGLTPEDIFHYIYAVFHSPAYRTRYAEFLKIDFPRLPLTSRLEVFRALARLGGELVALHLVEAQVQTGISIRNDKTDGWTFTYATPPPVRVAFTGPAEPVVDKVGWSDDTVWIDAVKPQKGATDVKVTGTAGFRGVPEEVWNFHIGGYQVCEKWLKDRKGRTLNADDLVHYHRIVVALHETIRLMAEIDRVIAAHGGWPLK
ncbi:MAG: type ISP restriction/modification enzyme, partial [Syntrophales bacterium]|nr:type ISP restriction/modification enzyme [Syntrophales bacterium]